ncbi:MAG: hypothetical protein QM692_04875 [Thermomicrobiales bacterium]
MDDNQFDAAVRALTTQPSRRDTLRLWTGAGLAGAIGIVGFPELAPGKGKNNNDRGKNNKNKKKKPKKKSQRKSWDVTKAQACLGLVTDVRDFDSAVQVVSDCVGGFYNLVREFMDTAICSTDFPRQWKFCGWSLEQEACSGTGSCFTGLVCADNECSSNSATVCCAQQNKPCEYNCDCCGWLYCIDGVCA